MVNITSWTNPYLCYCYLIGKEGNRSEYLKQKTSERKAPREFWFSMIKVVIVNSNSSETFSHYVSSQILTFFFSLSQALWNCTAFPDLLKNISNTKFLICKLLYFLSHNSLRFALFLIFNFKNVFFSLN